MCEQQTKKTEADEAIIETNDDAFESKIAAMEAGYFNDHFLYCMKNQHAYSLQKEKSRYRRQPMLNRGTYARVFIKEHLCQAFLSSGSSQGFVKQIISLGAGFDTYAFKLLETWSSRDSEIDNHAQMISYVELDLSLVVRDKLTLGCDFLKDGQMFSNVERGDGWWHGEVSRGELEGAKTVSNYWLECCDLRNVDALLKVLEHAKLHQKADTLVIAEMALVYLTPAQSDLVISTLGQWLTGQRVFFSLEPVGHDDAFGKQMDAHVAARGSTLLGLRAYPDLESQRRRFEQRGWSPCRAITMLSFWNACSTGQKISELQRIELLDEMEELNLLLEHYCIAIATGPCSQAGDCNPHNINIDQLIEAVRKY